MGRSSNSFLEARQQLDGRHDQNKNLLVGLRGAPTPILESRQFFRRTKSQQSQLISFLPDH